MEIVPLPENNVLLECMVVAKVLDEDGDPIWLLRNTTGMNGVEVIGALRVLTIRNEAAFESGWVSDDNESQDD
jgi:hypothetical protein